MGISHLKMNIMAGTRVSTRVSKWVNKGVKFTALALMALIIPTITTTELATSPLPLVSLAWADAKKETTGSVKGFYQSARAKLEKGRYVAAIEDLKKAIAIDKKNADVWSLYGFAARKAGSLRLAEKAYDKALSLDPNHLGALEYSGELYIEQAQLDKAQERLQRLKALCPQGCKELALLEQAMSAKNGAGAGLDGISHKIPKLKW